MPIPTEYENRDMNQEPEEFLLSQIRTILEYPDYPRPFVDEKIRDIYLEEIHEYMWRIQNSQDLPVKLLRIRSVELKEDLFYRVATYCNQSEVPYDSKLKHRIYFIETSDNAVVFIPIQIEIGLINIHLSLLDSENTHEEIYQMYQDLRKMNMKDIHFVKYNEEK